MFKRSFLTASLILLAFMGCSSSEQKKEAAQTYSPVGIWKGSQKPYMIKIAEGPVLEWAIVDPGAVKVYPNKRVEFPMKDDTIGFFETSTCPVVFNPQNGELSVEINVKRLLIPFPGDKLEGHVQHTFTGFISADGNVWDTTWFEVFDFGPRFPMAAPDEFTGVPMQFTRVEGENQ